MMTGEVLLLTSLKRGDSRARLGANMTKRMTPAWPAPPSWAGARVQSHLILAAIVY